MWTPKDDAWWNEVNSWEIVPLKYRVPMDWQINIGRQEIGLFDFDLLFDEFLSPLEFRLIIDICGSYPIGFIDLIRCKETEGVHGKIILGFEEAEVGKSTLLSLQAKGYISLHGFPNETT